MQQENEHNFPDPDNRKIIFQTKSHWFVFAPWLLATLIFIAVFILEHPWKSLFIFEYPWRPQVAFSQILIFLFVLIAWVACAAETVCRIALFATSEYSVSSDGILLIRGWFLGKIIKDINLPDVISVTLSSFNQQENCGTVVISTCDGKKHKLRDIKSPEEFMNYIISY